VSDQTHIIRGRAAVKALAMGAVLVAAALWGSPPAIAQDYPNKPIRFVVSSQAGGVVDIRARRVGARLGELLKQPIVVDNRPGASGTIGAEAVAKAAPDGYTALFGGNTELVVVPALGMPIRYDPLKDFIPVGQFSLGHPLLVVNAGLGIKSFAQLIEWARANPGKLLCGTAGHGSGQHFRCELIARSANVQLSSVPYKGTGPMLLDTATGQVHISMGFLAEVDKQYIQTGKVIPIAAFSPNRLARFPDVPTMAELGYPGFETVAWTGLFVPAGTPRPIINRLNAEITKMMREPEVIKWLTETGSEAPTPTPEQFGEFTRKELMSWRKMSDDFGIKAEQ
jgi:tripartite-type tricarboxylate transporter receptor subunit TctC